MDPRISGTPLAIDLHALQAQRDVPLASHSRFVQRIRRRYGDELALLPPGLPGRETIAALVQRLQADGRSFAAALRVARQLTIERLAVLDVEEGAPLADITRAMTELAEATLELALARTLADQDARFGVPRDADGQRIDFWIVGMGKLGARELNVSSDIDLIYVYESDGQTDGARPTSAHEYFAQVARGLYSLIGEVTDDGFVFRVDLALRPNGNSGPTAVSLAMLEEYLQAHGREWERFAWLKSRVVAPRASVTGGRAMPLRSLVTAFVYRRYLDYGVFEGLRQLHVKVRDEAQRRAAGRPERANDVKLSRGGIREIEFIVQLLLVVRGGQFPEIRTRSTLKALDRLAAGGLMQRATAERLADAYTMLRRVEHRIQYLDDQQTHVLPTDDADLRWIAASLGHDADDGVCTMLDLLGVARESVATEFDRLLHDPRRPAANAASGCRNCGPAQLPIDAGEFLAQLPEELRARVEPLCGHAKIRLLRDDSKVRLAHLIASAAQAVRGGRCTLGAAVQFVDWLEPLLRRESYLALLAERPEVQNRLLRLLGLARWPMRYLMLHPGVIDELADERLLHDRFDPEAYKGELEERHKGWERSSQAEEELLLDTLRRAHHAEVFRTLVRDVEGHLTVEQVADDLSALADATLCCALRWAWKHLKIAHRPDPQLAVIAYGKLGGKELGYGSDLDVVFVYDDPETDADKAAEVYSAFVRKLITWLTMRTAAGELFDIDTALRPNGSSGLLVTSMTSFENYQTGRGSNTAWTWEHQALTRARWCAGLERLAPRFEAVRRSVLAAPRDLQALLAQVRAMGEKVRAAHPVKGDRFDLKHSPGGMIDVEFAVQALVLGHGAQHAELLDDVGNIALLQRAEDALLLPPGVGRAAADAYRDLRSAQHRARLDEQPTQVDPAPLAAQSGAVIALSRAVCG
ncbi:MAG TPA: bifunctional [glutamate--ammonia ligase]-adenylyl-L-tyrosine phosphorylase/[glutamate--ammonia-ligase] adenylyltransferase [Caldimonas sp.]|jgi:glutamate-ammonia-ligase adenylyltransferase|nr:bifunctional [glutamate--ammonia ligase]-adenylyl-L-tyrosine phosphorylase/[glutamate--ammonia-ligase] adenylyltransferase [Caldimonas sp.]HEX4232981.1 bifunctional [glutamate--ammonia ligase]-adenylyl-L-tyrosine phosphorylase/[glutamate--ammonia-ligase] adenylyltransferase [Caldimonas sp.]